MLQLLCTLFLVSPFFNLSLFKKVKVFLSVDAYGYPYEIPTTFMSNRFSPLQSGSFHSCDRASYPLLFCDRRPIETSLSFPPEKSPVPLETALAKSVPEAPATKENKETRKAAPKVKPVYRRNIYKSILRNMRKYAKKNSKIITEKLIGNGYAVKGIEHAFYIVNNYKKVEGQRGSRQKYRKLLENIANEGSILTHILKDSLKQKINALEDGNHGRIAWDNYNVYKKAYTDFYDKVLAMLDDKSNQMVKANEKKDEPKTPLTH